MEHKLIQGGEQYLPFARSRIKALRATGMQFASQQFIVSGVTIRVRISGEHDYIRIDASGSSGYLVTPVSASNPAGTGSPPEARIVVGGLKPKITEHSLFDAYYTSWAGSDKDVLLYETGIAGRYIINPIGRTGGVPFGSGGPIYVYLNEVKLTLTGTPHGMGLALFGEDRFVIFANNLTDTLTRFYASKNGAAFALVGEVTCGSTQVLQNTWMFSPDGKRAVTKRRKLLPDAPGTFSEYRMPLATPVEVVFDVDLSGALVCTTVVGAEVGIFQAISPAPPPAPTTEIVPKNEAYNTVKTTTTASGQYGLSIDIQCVVGFEYVDGAPQPVTVRVEESGAIDKVQISYDGEIDNGVEPTPSPPYTPFTSKASFTNNVSRSRTLSVSVGGVPFYSKTVEVERVTASLLGVGASDTSGWDSGSSVTLTKTMIPGFTHIDGRDKSCSGILLQTNTSSTASYSGNVSTPSTTGPDNTATTFLTTRYEAKEVVAYQVVGDNGSYGWVAPVPGFTSGPTAIYAPQSTSPITYADVMMLIASYCLASRRAGEYVFSQRIDARQTAYTGYGGTGIGGLTPNFYSAGSPNSGAYSNLKDYFTLGSEAGFGLSTPRIIPQAKKGS